MKRSFEEGIASRFGSESCMYSCKGVGEALTRVASPCGITFIPWETRTWSANRVFGQQNDGVKTPFGANIRRRDLPTTFLLHGM